MKTSERASRSRGTGLFGSAACGMVLSLAGCSEPGDAARHAPAAQGGGPTQTNRRIDSGDFSRVRPGMTRDQVSSLLGSPKSEMGDGEFGTWTYELPSRPFADGVAKVIGCTIQFHEGKVVQVSPTLGSVP